MITKDAFIVFQSTPNGPYPCMVCESKEDAYNFIATITGNKGVSPNEWSIFHTKMQARAQNRVIPGQLDVIIPPHVID